MVYVVVLGELMSEAEGEGEERERGRFLPSGI